MSPQEQLNVMCKQLETIQKQLERRTDILLKEQV